MPTFIDIELNPKAEVCVERIADDMCELVCIDFYAETRLVYSTYYKIRFEIMVDRKAASVVRQSRYLTNYVNTMYAGWVDRVHVPSWKAPWIVDYVYNWILGRAY